MLWIVEAHAIFSKKDWAPVLGFPGVSGVHRTRESARKAKQKMADENQYNQSGMITVRYRVVKYVREGEFQRMFVEEPNVT